MHEVTTVSHTTGEIRAKSLGEATMQEIQLELIRRRQFNCFDGQRIADCLLQHRDLWEAVMMDRLAISHPGSLPTLGLMKLRDLPKDEWNVDTLYILSHTKSDAQNLAEILSMRKWGGMVDIYTKPDEIDSPLGGAGRGQAVISIWWE